MHSSDPSTAGTESVPTMASDTTKSTRRILITSATYNEIDNVPKLVAAILDEVPQADVLVVDDNSPDGTGRWCDEFSQTEPRLKCLHREGKLGLGTAIVAAMRYAIEHGYDYVLNLDADFSHPIRYLNEIIQRMNPVDSDSVDGEPADVVIGSRYIPGGGIEGWSLKRHLMSRAVNLYARSFLSLAAKDCSGGYRCYRVSQLDKIDLDGLISRGYSFQEEVLWRLKQSGARIAEVPIVFVDREHGQSKINNREAVEALRVIFKLGLNNWFRIGKS